MFQSLPLPKVVSAFALGVLLLSIVGCSSNTMPQAASVIDLSRARIGAARSSLYVLNEFNGGFNVIVYAAPWTARSAPVRKIDLPFYHGSHPDGIAARHDGMLAVAYEFGSSFSAYGGVAIIAKGSSKLRFLKGTTSAVNVLFDSRDNLIVNEGDDVKIYVAPYDGEPFAKIIGSLGELDRHDDLFVVQDTTGDERIVDFGPFYRRPIRTIDVPFHKGCVENGAVGPSDQLFVSGIAKGPGYGCHGSVRIAVLFPPYRSASFLRRTGLLNWYYLAVSDTGTLFASAGPFAVKQIYEYQSPYTGWPRQFDVAGYITTLYFANGYLFAGQEEVRGPYALCIYPTTYKTRACITKGVDHPLAMAVTP